MGFIIFFCAAIAGVVALGLSAVFAAIGICIYYIRRKQHTPKTNNLFFTPAIATMLVSYVVITIWPFPQGNPGSNYTEILVEWVAKAIIYPLAPGIGCLLGGLAILLFSNRKSNSLTTT